jgi:two-component system OmpR family response regulator
MAEATRRILVVDDAAEICGVLTRYFTESGYEVRSAANGKEGLTLARIWSPDIILLDLEMPEMSGLDVLRHVIADHSGIPVVAVSGHNAAEQLGKDAKRLGACEFVSKPFDLQQLGDMVRGLLDGSET